MPPDLQGPRQRLGEPRAPFHEPNAPSPKSGQKCRQRAIQPNRRDQLKPSQEESPLVQARERNGFQTRLCVFFNTPVLPNKFKFSLMRDTSNFGTFAEPNSSHFEFIRTSG